MPRLFFIFLSRLQRHIENLHRFLGQSLACFNLAMAAIVAFIVCARLFDFGSTAVQESVTYIHAMIFMLCLGYAGINNAHVRVDICYRKYSPLTKAWVNALGTLFFLLPFSLFLTAISLDTAIHSWQVREASINAGGLALVYILKSLPPLAGVLLCLYGVSDLAKQLLTISLPDADSEESCDTDDA